MQKQSAIAKNPWRCYLSSLSWTRHGYACASEAALSQKVQSRFNQTAVSPDPRERQRKRTSV